MRVLVYEYVTACLDLGADLPASLAVEGLAMLNGLLEDSRGLHGIETHTISSRPLPMHTSIRVHASDPAKDWLDSFREVIESVDAVLIVAPEFERILEKLTLVAEERKKILVGSSSVGVALAADKLACERLWESRGIPTPTCRLLNWNDWSAPPNDLTLPVVVKPRDGAGSQGVRLIRDVQNWRTAIEEARAESPSVDWIAQPFVTGQAASVACLVHGEEALALLPSTQRLSEDGRFQYSGGEIPLHPKLCKRAQRLARRAVSEIPGLRGYVGIDLILGDSADGCDDCVIELNPRVTTSYLGLRALCKQNLLGAILGARSEASLPALEWDSSKIRFEANGDVSEFSD